MAHSEDRFRRRAPSPKRISPPPAAPLGALLLLWMTWAVACGGAADPEGVRPADSAASPPPDAPSLVLITVDTLRADALGVYGGPPTPTFDALGEDGWIFDHAVTPMPVTRPSHASMLTSLHPRSHGVLSNAFVLDAGVPTVAEILAREGWRTAAFTGVKLLAPGSGLERGFETFEAPSKGEHVVAGEVIPMAMDWLRRVDGPFLLWVHVYDPHMPYGPPEPFSVAPPAPWSAEELPEFSRPNVYPLVERTQGDLPEELLRWALSQYAAEVTYVDRQLELLLAAVEEVAPEAAVLLTSDHGECFGNGFYFEHGPCLYEGAVRVPMLLRAPGAQVPRPDGGRVARQVSVLDVAPTLLELAGVEIPESFAGRSLLVAEEGAGPPVLLERPLYDDDAQGRRDRRRDRIASIAGDPVAELVAGEVLGVRVGPESEAGAAKYLASAAGEELYRLAGDGEERRNLVEEQPQQAQELRALLRRLLTRTPVAPSAEDADEELRRTLESLGY